MELIRGLHNLRPRHRGCVATIGNFDGVHAGHRVLIDGLRCRAAADRLPLTVISFEPLPAEFFVPQQAPARLCSCRDKLRLLHQLGVDRVLILRFNAALAATPARTFVERILVAGLGLRHLVVGDDFRFGQGRLGDADLLRQLGQVHDYSVAATPTVLIDGARVSSTRVRQAVTSGNFQLAARLLGRPFAVSGRVQHGDARGRTLGFPTANLRLPHSPSPLAGVYAVTVELPDGRRWPGVANAGRRPTVNGDVARLEVHLLDYAGDLYGTTLCVHFERFLRAECRFASLDALRRQIACDVDSARAHFAAPQPPLFPA